MPGYFEQQNNPDDPEELFGDIDAMNNDIVQSHLGVFTLEKF